MNLRSCRCVVSCFSLFSTWLSERKVFCFFHLTFSLFLSNFQMTPLIGVRVEQTNFLLCFSIYVQIGNSRFQSNKRMSQLTVSHMWRPLYYYIIIIPCSRYNTNIIYYIVVSTLKWMDKNNGGKKKLKRYNGNIICCDVCVYNMCRKQFTKTRLLQYLYTI